MKFTILLLLIYIMQIANPLDSLKWKNRILLISGNNEDLVSRQMEIWNKDSVEISERELLIFDLRSPKNNDFSLPENNFLTNQYQLDDNSFKVILIGKDGSVKLVKESILKNEDLYGLIDSMPMRQREMKQRNKH